MRLSISLNLTIELNGREIRLTRLSWARRRKQVKSRDGAICQHCGTEAQDGHVDHILPLSRGGTDALSNLAWYCKECNLAKGDKTLAEWAASQKELTEDERQVKEQAELIRELADQDLSKRAIQMKVFGYVGGAAFDKVSNALANYTPKTEED